VTEGERPNSQRPFALLAVAKERPTRLPPLRPHHARGIGTYRTQSELAPTSKRRFCLPPTTFRSANLRQGEICHSQQAFLNAANERPTNVPGAWCCPTSKRRGLPTSQASDHLSIVKQPTPFCFACCCQGLANELASALTPQRSWRRNLLTRGELAPASTRRFAANLRPPFNQLCARSPSCETQWRYAWWVLACLPDEGLTVPLVRRPLPRRARDRHRHAQLPANWQRWRFWSAPRTASSATSAMSACAQS
jgi:hypothetical protein